MGCDIHLYVERRDRLERLDPMPWTLLYCEEADSDFNDYDKDDLNPMRLMGRRDYAVFGVIAGLRDTSGSGKPNGLPEDICPATKKYMDSWRGDYHSHGYCTLFHFLHVKSTAMMHANIFPTASDIEKQMMEDEFEISSLSMENKCKWILNNIEDHCKHYPDSVVVAFRKIITTIGRRDHDYRVVYAFDN